MDVDAKIIVPDFFCSGIFGGGFVVEEDDIGFHALFVKHAGGKPEHSMQIGVTEQFLPDFFSSAAFKQDVIWHHNCRFAGGLENCANMLNKIELFV